MVTDLYTQSRPGLGSEALSPNLYGVNLALLLAQGSKKVPRDQNTAENGRSSTMAGRDGNAIVQTGMLLGGQSLPTGTIRLRR